MKDILVKILICGCLFSSCISTYYSTEPSASPNVYIEKSFHDVVNGNILGTEAYKKIWTTTYKRYFKFVSDVYLKNISNNTWAIYNNDGDYREIEITYELYRNFNLQDNSDFDPNEKYFVEYTFVWAGPDENDTGNITIDNIRGLSSYNRKRGKIYVAEQEDERQELLRKQAEMEAMYEFALKSNGVDLLVEYI
jgi:hypothetical protein